jgi:PAS domain S-box-containing protein
MSEQEHDDAANPGSIEDSILIVDDDEDFSSTLAEILMAHGYEHYVANNFDDAARMIADKHPSMCLLDLRLGTASGLDLLGFIQEESPDTLSLVLTGYGTIESAIEAVKKGAYDYLRKPVFGPELIAAVERCMDKIHLTRGQREAEAALKERNRELETINARLQKIVESTKELTCYLDLDSFGQKLIEEFTRLMASSGSIFIREDDGLHLVHTLDTGHLPTHVPFPLRDDSPMAQAFNTKRPVLFANMAGDSKINSSGWNGYRDGSCMVIPLLRDDQEVVGIVTLHNKAWPPFTEQDLELSRVFCSVSQEILRSIETTQSLHESEIRFRELAELLPEIVFEIDGEGRLLFLNEHAMEATGFTREELERQPNVLSFLSSGDQSRAGQNIAAKIRGEDISNQEYKITRKDGSTFDALARSSPILQDGVPIGIRGILIDITERKNSEEHRRLHELRFQQMQKMESLGVLAGGIAHDFNNVLAGIVGNIDFANTSESLSPGGHELLNQALLATERGTDLCNQLLVYAGKRESSREVVNLSELLTEMTEIIRMSIPRTVEVLYDCSTDLPGFECDPTRIRQILMNLVKNAADAIGDQPGQISVQTCTVECEKSGFEDAIIGSDSESGRFLKLTVKDSGTGMNEDTVQRIFDPFYSTKSEGRGLGLSTMIGVVREHGGALTVTSELNKGSTFSIFFPT